MAIYDCTPDGGGNSNNYIAGNGIQINEQTISAKISSEIDNVTQIYNGAIYTPTLKITTIYPLVEVILPIQSSGIVVNVSKGDTTVTGETNENGVASINIPAFGIWNISATVEEIEYIQTIIVNSVEEYQVNLYMKDVYGVEWDGSASTVLSRTDAAELFPEPEPALNNGTGSSPFDDIMPWSGMTRVTDPVAGEMVQIPKYWYKITQNGNGLKLQIATKQLPGFYVSPAHADRGDGQGERDVVYVGRYHCGSDYKSITKVLPINNILMENARNSINLLGEEYFIFDYAMAQTINMLYLVEFANWNFKNVIGYGCGNNNSIQNMGYTDAMQYHTGTTQASRATYGLGTQYRYIEGLRDNVYDLMDGIYFSGQKIYYNNNPRTYLNNSNGQEVGEILNTSQKNISSFLLSSENSFLLLPSFNENAMANTYTCSYFYYSSGDRAGFFGSSYFQNNLDNLFNFGSNLPYTNANRPTIGVRIQKLSKIE